MNESEIHIWHTRLDSGDADLARYASLLSGEEKNRAARFRFDLHRNRFVTARGVLRLLLGKYLAMSPESVEIRTCDRGKPHVADGQNRGNLRFNLSHSGDIAVYAFALDNEVGIDIEVADKRRNSLNISRSYFTDSETRSLEEIGTQEEREVGFLKLWTRKEACIKCTGDGLGVKLDSFDVSRATIDRPTEVMLGNNRMLVCDLPAPGDKAVSAIAYSGERSLRHVYRQWQG